jgi:hypothetical protein
LSSALLACALHRIERPSKRIPVSSTKVGIDCRLVRIGRGTGISIRHAGVDS